MSYQQPTTISRKARIWPEIPQETVQLPAPPQLPQAPQPSMLTSVLFSLLGTGTYALIVTNNSNGRAQYLFLPFLAISGMMALGTLTSYSVQFIGTRRQIKRYLASYRRKLEEAEERLQALQLQERQARIEQDPPFVLPAASPEWYQELSIRPLIEQRFDDQNVSLWARRPDDPDFLSVRVGMGLRPASFSVHRNMHHDRLDVDRQLEEQNAYAQQLQEKYKQVMVPLTVSLPEQGPIALVGSKERLTRARNALHAMVGQIAYHHSPEDVRIIILAPRSQENAWHWATLLPHTIQYDPRLSGENNDEHEGKRAVAFGAAEVLEQLPLISRELGRRELLLGDSRRDGKQPILPHLIIVVDHFDPETDLDQPTLAMPVLKPEGGHPLTTTIPNTPVDYRPHLSISPLKRPEMTLALTPQARLGVSVLSVNASRAEVPTTSKLIIDLDVPPQGDTQTPQALLHELSPTPPPAVACLELDSVPQQALTYFAQRLQPLKAMSTKRLELRTQVDLRMLFEPPLDLAHYDPLSRWSDPLFHTTDSRGNEKPTMRIPIGLKIGDEVQYLDFLKDGPHGLLIGQTGSGKSELLQTIVMALAIAYRPTEVNFLLIDYKAGLALEPFRHLPHTIGFLSNVSSPALIQRFITMLRAEATRREIKLKEGKTLPRLVIIIDEFAEMLKRTDSVLDELFTITRVGREIGMHLLLAAQRPEGIIATRVRDYVQYRLCLRCASPEDSREVLRRVDAANLPASIPGRGYLLHGDNQLDLFQAARVTIPVTLEQLYHQPRTPSGKHVSLDPTNDILLAQLTKEKP